MMNEKLHEGCARLGLALDDTQFAALETYMACVLEFNKGYNLMKASSEDELAVNHVLDSLAAVPELERLAAGLRGPDRGQRLHLADIGSGGGCPGLPLAVAFPAERFTLVERMEKRCAFLESAVSAMGLTNVTVSCTQADAVPTASVDIAVFRAFHPFDKKIARLLLAMLRPGGYIAAYKARSEKIAAEMALPEVRALMPAYTKKALTVPFLEDHERNLVIVQKQPAVTL